MKIKFLTQLMTLLLMFAGLSLSAYAFLPGTLDTTFGSSGFALKKVSTSDDEILAVATQSDNKIVAAGYSGSPADFTVARFNTNGAIDTTFGTNGIAITPFQIPNNLNNLVNAYSVAYSVAIQSDGKIVVGGDIGSGQAFGLVRYSATGQLDTSFGNGGKVITNTQGLAGIREITIQSDGKIIAVGYTTQISDFAIARYTSSGVLDTTFGSGDGIVTTDFFNDNDVATSVKLQSDGKIVVAGSAIDLDLLTEFALARYNSDGSLDPGFNTTGLETTPLDCGADLSGCGVDALGIQPDGKIVVTGSKDDVYLARYNSDGSQINGIITTNIGGNSDRAYSMKIDSIGGILIAGSTLSQGDEDFFVAKYQSDGTLDTSFDNGDGIVITSLGSNSDIGRAINLQPNGGIIVGGSQGDFGSKQFAAARYIGFQPTAASATISGRVTTSTGTGISGARIALTDSQNNTVYAVTNALGKYTFINVSVNASYILTANAKRYTFSPASRLISLTDDYTGADFVGALSGGSQD